MLKGEGGERGCTAYEEGAPKIEVPKSHVFNYKRDTKELNNYL